MIAKGFGARARRVLTDPNRIIGLAGALALMLIAALGLLGIATPLSLLSTLGGFVVGYLLCLLVNGMLGTFGDRGRPS